MLKEVGYCKGIENYTRHLSGAKPGRAAADADRLPAARTALMFLDESHVHDRPVRRHVQRRPLAQDHLVEYGFRLPSALDNRPLKFDEFERKMRQACSSPRRPADYEKTSTPARWSSRWCAPPAWSTRWSRCARRRTRSTTCCGEIRQRVDDERAGAGHHADQAHGRAAHRLSWPRTA